MKNFCIVFNLLLVLSSENICNAQDHLFQETSILSGGLIIPNYYHNVAYVLREAYNKNVVFRMVGLPSFRPEYAVGIKKLNNQFYAFRVSPTLQVWGYTASELEASGTIVIVPEEGGEKIRQDEIDEKMKHYPKKIQDLKVEYC